MQPVAGLPCVLSGNRVGKAVKEKAKELQVQQQQRRESETRQHNNRTVRRHSSPASSRQGSFDTDPLDMSPLNSPLSGATRLAAHRDDSDLVDDEDATDWNDFSLSSPPSPKNLDRKRPNNVYGEEDDVNVLPVEITHQEPLKSLDDLKVGDGFVETDFKTTIPHAQWFDCKFISLAPNDAEADERRRNERPPKGWESSETLILCSSHAVGIRLYKPSTAQPSMSEKARHARNEVAKRLGKWMGRLKQSNTGGGAESGGLLDKSSDASADGTSGGTISGVLEEEYHEELDVVGPYGDAGKDGSSAASNAGNADRQLLPVLVRVDFIASVLQISRLKREEEYARCANVLLWRARTAHVPAC